MNRKLLIAISLVFLFAVGVIVWYFFFSTPKEASSLGVPNDPLPRNELPPRFQFINTGTEEDTSSYTEVTQKLEDPLIRVWDKPTAGHFFIVDTILKEEIATSTEGTTTTQIKKTVRATTTTLLFVDRETGYIYGYKPETNYVFQITNTLIPGVYDAYFFNGGNRVIMRYRDEEEMGAIITIVGNLPRFTQGGEPSNLSRVEYLNGEVTSVSVDPAGEEAAFLVKNNNGGTVYTISSSNPTQIAASLFTEWTLSHGGKTLYATSKPSAYAFGITVRLPSFVTIIGERPGLITTPGENAFIQSIRIPGGVQTSFLNNARSFSFSAKTMASKCVWEDNVMILCAVPKNMFIRGKELPDAWLQGFVQFEDELISINTTSGEEKLFFSFENRYGLFDIVRLIISQDNSLIGFINKRTGELWVIKKELLTLGQ